MSVENPNFTIIASGGCAADCSFCTDSYSRKAAPEYIQNLGRILMENKLPPQFVECSISGGEPTTSPHLKDILRLVNNCGRFHKIVFTTNGHKLLEHADLISKKINHLNVSRHAIGYENNVPIFKTKNIITDEDLTKVVRIMNKRGVDVNLNHVYTKDSSLTEDYVYDYVAYAKSVGASSVSFRYDQNENSLAPTYLEEIFKDHKVLRKGECPVCRNHAIMLMGLQVVFKASFVEPAQTLNQLYELVYHLDGNLYMDWEGTMPYDLEEDTDDVEKLIKMHAQEELIEELKKVPEPKKIKSKDKSNPWAEIFKNQKQSMPSYGGGCSSYGGGCA